MRELRNLVATRKLDIVAIQVTKCDFAMEKEVLQSSIGSLRGFSLSPLVGRSGRISIMWNEGLLVGVMVLCSRFILTVKFRCKSNNSQFCLASVYGTLRANDKGAFFGNLKELIVSSNETAWCICGNFNAVRKPGEMQNQLQWTQEMALFNRWVNELALAFRVSV